MSEPLFSDAPGEDWAASNVEFDLSTVEPEPITFGVPEYQIEDGHSMGQSRLDSGPPLSMRERLNNLTGKKKETPQPRSRNVKKTVKAPVPNVPGQFVEPLTDIYNGLALLAMPFDPELAMVMTSPHRAPKEGEEPESVPTVAENCARAMDEAAQRSESLRRVLANITTASVWGAVITAHLPIAMILVKNHTPLGRGSDPAAAMEEMLKRQAANDDHTGP